jgi:Tol biopolymer transport system component
MKRGDDTHVAVIPSGGGAPLQLTNEAGQSWPGSWSPDGDKIAFAGMRDGYWNIWWVSRDARRRKQITKLTKPNAYVRFPSWSPRGDQIVYEYAETTGNIWVMELK